MNDSVGTCIPLHTYSLVHCVINRDMHMREFDFVIDPMFVMLDSSLSGCGAEPL